MESKHYSYDEAYDATLKYFGGDELAARVWVSKYAGSFLRGQRYPYFNCGTGL